MPSRACYRATHDTVGFARKRRLDVFGSWSVPNAPQTTGAYTTSNEVRDFSTNGSVFHPAGGRQAFAVSPDGSRIAFTTIGEGGLYCLWIRLLTSLDAQDAPAARGAPTLFWSPPFPL